VATLEVAERAGEAKLKKRLVICRNCLAAPDDANNVSR
jgi:hypothetical protein